MSNIFCGIGEAAKGDKLGTMKECIEKGQVRRFGIYKVDTKTLTKIKNDIAETKTIAEKIADLENQVSGLRAKHTKLSKKIKDESDAKEKALLKKQDADTIKEHNHLSDELKKLRAKAEKLSKRSSKRRSKRHSKRHSKRGSKRRSKRHSKRHSKRRSR